MNHLTLQGMNGCAGALRGLSAPLTIEIDHEDMRARLRHGLVGLPPDDLLDQDSAAGLARNWAPWWHPMPAARAPVGPVPRQGRPERGEAYIARADRRASRPLTWSSDERNLPSPFTGKPLRRYPVRAYPGSFPHGWIDHADLRPAAGPEDRSMPSPPGWAPPVAIDEERRAVDAALPGPWVAEEAMANDISGFGFGSLHDAFMGGPRLGDLGQAAIPTSVTSAIAGQALQAGATAAAQGATPSLTQQIVNSVVDFGSSAASLYLQQREMERRRQEERRLRALEAQRLAAQAAAAGVPFRPVSADGGIGVGTVAGSGAGVLALGALAYALTRKGRRR